MDAVTSSKLPGRARVVVPLLLLAPALTPALAGCVWTERICGGDETVVVNAAGGRSCRPRQGGDPDCGLGERARERLPSGRLDCVPDRA